MLVLFESAAGYALFKVVDEAKVQNADDIHKYFETPDKASKVVKLKHFEKFENINEAVAGNLTIENEKVNKNLKTVIKKHVLKEAEAELAVADAKLGKLLKKKFDVNCVYNTAVQELTRNIRSQISSLLSSSVEQSNLAQMALGLAHSLGRYRLKFSPDKVDTMIVQAVSLLDDVDKELNNYIMRLREWYGWHFPELSKIVSDNLAYARIVKEIASHFLGGGNYEDEDPGPSAAPPPFKPECPPGLKDLTDEGKWTRKSCYDFMSQGDRTHAMTMDMSEILPEHLEKEVKWAAEISMGTEIAEDDILNIKFLCEQVIEMSKTRDELYSYLKERMTMVAPNLTVLVGELVGARLIAHAGSLLNLAKHPSSTVQILGAEKALFRALKTKHDTPKYGLIYHASLVGGAQPKLKGKLSRMLAAKAALAIRVDALSEESDCSMGIEQRAKLENRIRNLDEKAARRISGTGKFQYKQEKYTNVSEVKTFNTAQDSTLPVPLKRKIKDEPKDEEEQESTPIKPPKAKKVKLQVTEEATEETPKKKKKKKKQEADESMVVETQAKDEVEDDPGSSKKKKKKKKEKKAVEDSD